MNYHAYDFEGNIVRSGTLEFAQWHLYESPDYTLVDGVADTLCDFMQDGVLCRYTPAQIEARNNRPDYACRWSVAARDWQDLRTPQDHLDAVRRKRTALLLASDWTQLPDVPLVTQAAWATYRQALRDITEQEDMAGVVWPGVP